MRLSGWRKTAPAMESMSGEVVAVLPAVLVDLGAEADPECWVAWGDDPHMRYSVLVPTIAGLIIALVRPGGPDGGPRVSAKLIRWSKLAIGELGIDSTDGHRIVAVQVETIVLKGVDEEAGRICEFVRGLVAEVEDRHAAPASIAVAQEAPVRAAAGAAQTYAPAEPAVEPTASSVPAPDAPAPSAAAAAPKPEPAPALPLPALPLPLPALPKPEPAPPKPEPAPAPEPAAATPEPVPLQAEETESLPPAARQAAPETEVDRSQWIPPHPIGAAAPRKSRRPRPWRP